MVLTHTTTHTYAHPFPAVTLAYFIRYSSPKLNPFAAHVLSTDTIDSRVDLATGRLHTIRIHLKKSRMPSAVFKLLPASMTGGGGGGTIDSPVGSGGSASAAGDRASYILETSIIDMREGWMRTESRNLNWTGVLEVIERQDYHVPSRSPPPPLPASTPLSASSPLPVSSSALPAASPLPALSPLPAAAAATTHVATTVIFRSRLGELLRGRVAAMSSAPSHTPSPPPPPLSRPLPAAQGPTVGWLPGWIGAWGASGIQRSIETLASKKTKDGMVRSHEGMRVVLERLRSSGGLSGLLEQVRRERQEYG